MYSRTRVPPCFLLCRRELQRVTEVFAVRTQPVPPLFERAEGLLQGFLECPAEGHRLADGLHLDAEDLVDTLELLEVPARDLHDAVVDGRLEGGGRDLA